VSDSPKTPAELLANTRETMRAIDQTGVERPIHSEISAEFSKALTDIVTREQPKLVIEIGMACGLSTLSILSALPQDGVLMSVDPFQSTDYHGVGATLVGKSTRAASHRLIEKADYLALPEMVAEGVQADLVYIDGMHTFDYVALDAFYAHKLLRIGGIMAFNDCGFRSIHKFLKYFPKHRQYEELDVGLKPDFTGANPLFTAIRRATGRSNQDRYFRKLSDWEPPHNFFKSF